MEQKDETELTIFKEEILKNIREIEKKLTVQINIKNSKITSDYEEISHKLESMLESNSAMIEAFTKQKLQNQKVEELSTLLKSIDERLITNEIRTKNHLNEFDRVRTSYDKIISDNLNVPGIVGIGCTYKNLSDYITNNLQDMTKIKSDYEIQKHEKKTNQNKPDVLFMKNINRMLDLNLVKSKDYTDTIANNIKSIFLKKDKEIEDIKIEFKDIMNEYQLINDGKVSLIEKEISKFEKEKARTNVFIEKTDELIKKNEDINKKIQNLEKALEKYNSSETKIYEKLSAAFNEIAEIKKQLKNNYLYCIDQIKKLTTTNNTMKNNTQILENENINNVSSNNNTNTKGLYGNSVQKILKKKAQSNNTNTLPLLNPNQPIEPNYYSPRKNINREIINNKEIISIKGEKKITEEDNNNDQLKKETDHKNNRNRKRFSVDLTGNYDNKKFKNSINEPTVKNIINRNSDILNIIKNNNFTEKNNTLDSNDNLEKCKNQKKEAISRNTQIIEGPKTFSDVNKNTIEQEKESDETEIFSKINMEKDNSEKEKNKTIAKNENGLLDINENNNIKNNKKEVIRIIKSYKERNAQKDFEDNKDIKMTQDIKEYTDISPRNNFFTTNLKISKSKPSKSFKTNKEDDSKKKNVFATIENIKNDYQDLKSKISNNKINSYQNIKKINNQKIINTEYNTNNISNKIESIKEILKSDKNKNLFKKGDYSIFNNVTDVSNIITNEKDIENNYKHLQTTLNKDVHQSHKTAHSHNKVFMSEFNEINNLSFHKQKEPQTASRNLVDCKLVNLNNVDVPEKMKSLSEKNSDLLDLKKNGLSPPFGGKLPIKPSPAFGRTAYAFYKKDSGQMLNNIDNIFNAAKSGEFNVEFAPFSGKDSNVC